MSPRTNIPRRSGKTASARPRTSLNGGTRSAFESAGRAVMDLVRRRPRVLVLDDDPSIQRLVSALLRRKGYRVDVVSSGRQAIAAIEANDYAAMLLDLMMPYEGGMTVLKHLRRRDPDLVNRVIIVTATPDSVIRSISSGVFAVVKKPFDPGDLVATVEKLA